MLEEESEFKGVVFLAAGLGKIGGIVSYFHAVAVPPTPLLAGFEEGEEQRLQSVAEEGVGFFLSKGTKYKIGDAKGIFGVGLHVPDGEVEPLVVAVGIGVVLHEEGVGI